MQLNPLLPAFAAALAMTTILPAAENKTIVEKHAPGVAYNIPLWPEGQVPLAKGDGPLDNPFLTVFLPPAGKGNGAAAVVAPGGSNIMLMYGAEGIDIAERFNDWGIATFVLTYRLSPRYNADARLLDGRRAMQIVRSRAEEFHINPKSIGFIGFSAGSETGRAVTANVAKGDPAAADPIERVSSRPDWLGLVYSVGRTSPGEDLKTFPPTFLISAAGDRGPSLGNAQFFAELLRANVNAEVHVYQGGHHGFGDGFASGTLSDWMGRLEHFLKQAEFIPGGKK